jgi:hypothetical protein
VSGSESLEKSRVRIEGVESIWVVVVVDDCFVVDKVSKNKRGTKNNVFHVLCAIVIQNLKQRDDWTIVSRALFGLRQAQCLTVCSSEESGTGWVMSGSSQGGVNHRTGVSHLGEQRTLKHWDSRL